MEPLLKPSQAWRLLNVGRTTFYRMVNEEGLPVINVGRGLRIRPTDLDKWLEQRRRKGELTNGSEKGKAAQKTQGWTLQEHRYGRRAPRR